MSAFLIFWGLKQYSRAILSSNALEQWFPRAQAMVPEGSRIWSSGGSNNIFLVLISGGFGFDFLGALGFLGAQSIVFCFDFLEAQSKAALFWY